MFKFDIGKVNCRKVSSCSKVTLKATQIHNNVSFAHLRIPYSSKKRHRCLFSFEALRGGTYERVELKRGGAYFKVKGIIPFEFQNFIFFSFQITVNNYHYDI